MKRIGNSKEPTPARMLAVVEDLGNLFKKYVSLEANARAYQTSTGTKISYRLYVEDLHHIPDLTWPQVISEYRRLRKEVTNAS